MNKFFLIVAVLLLMVTGILLWATRGDETSSVDETVAVSGEEDIGYSANANVGGGFELIDQNGKTKTDADFRGKVMLVFFGFTHCPDICPVTVSTLSSLMELLGDKANMVAPIFISVDPERDTPEVLKSYLSNFDARIVGLTGTAEQTKSVADAYKVYYARAHQEESYEGADDGAYPHNDENPPALTKDKDKDGDNYLIDHSGYIYLMDTNGKYVEHFRYDVSEQELADALKPYLK